VETRHGLGTFVGQSSLAPLIDGMAFTLSQRIGGDTRALRELLELREILEVELVRRVTGQHSEAQRARLDALVAQMEENARASFIDPALDSAFHDALYEPLGNRAVTLLLHSFWEVQERVRSQLPSDIEIPNLFAANAAWHRAIVRAVSSGDLTAAAAAMQEHFTGIERRMELLGPDGDG
jgi:DNA-binding FadR family transcriptional regulator